MWMMPLHLYINQKSDNDDDVCIGFAILVLVLALLHVLAVVWLSVFYASSTQYYVLDVIATFNFHNSITEAFDEMK